MASSTDPKTLSVDGFLEGTVGKRVSIRLLDEGGGFRDLLGELIATDSVERKDGSIVRFDRARVVAFRIVESKS
jgi:hypothetical protein